MATVPVQITWVTGQIVSAAQMNTNVRDPVNFLINRPVFEGRQTVSQSLSNGGVTPITLDVEDVDNDNGHSTVTNTSRYVAQTAGRFQVSVGVGWAASASGRRQAGINVNGTAVNANTGTLPAGVATVIRTPNQTKTVFLNVGDYVEIIGFQDSGGALSTAVDADHQSGMSVLWVGTT